MSNYKYLRCLKSDGKMLTGEFEDEPINGNALVFWIKVADDQNGDFTLPEIPWLKQDRVIFTLASSLTSAELSKLLLIKNENAGTWSHLMSLADLKAHVKAIIKKEARVIIESSDRKSLRHKDEVDDGLIEANRTLSDVNYQLLLDERKTTRDESTTFRTDIDGKTTADDPTTGVLTYEYTFTESAHVD